MDEDRRPVAEVVSELRSEPKNTDLQIAYTGGYDYYDDFYYYDEYYYWSPLRGASRSSAQRAYNPAPTSAEGSATTDWYLRGMVSKSVATMRMSASAQTIDYGGRVRLYGSVYPVAGDTTVTLFGRSPGQSRDTTLVRGVRAPLSSAVTASFSLWRTLSRNTTLTTVFWGDSRSLAASAARRVNVRARVRLAANRTRVPYGAPVTLTARITPAQVRGRIVFLALSGEGGRRLATKTVGSTARVTFRPQWGDTRVLAVFMGTSRNAASISNRVLVSAR